ncbi:MAG: hypothetical protein ACYDAQ_08575 [Mycobacteriales bacterium]
MTAERTCAAAGCDNPVERLDGQTGRPRIYCSPTCRPSMGGRQDRYRISVQVDQDQDGRDGPDPGRSWVVRLRRGQRTVIVGEALGRFAATALAGELRNLLHPRPRGGGS